MLTYLCSHVDITRRNVSIKSYNAWIKSYDLLLLYSYENKLHNGYLNTLSVNAVMSNFSHQVNLPGSSSSSSNNLSSVLIVLILMTSVVSFVELYNVVPRMFQCGVLIRRLRYICS